MLHMQERKVKMNRTPGSYSIVNGVGSDPSDRERAEREGRSHDWQTRPTVPGMRKVNTPNKTTAPEKG
jgi:hypothetical protein